MKILKKKLFHRRIPNTISDKLAKEFFIPVILIKPGHRKVLRGENSLRLVGWRFSQIKKVLTWEGVTLIYDLQGCIGKNHS